MKNIRDLAMSRKEYAISLRRELHRHPELSFHENKTSARVLSELKQMGIFCRLVTETGVVAEIKGGRPGGIVALRADMDALEIEETTGLAFQSENKGVMHACGHDIHTAALVTAAGMLNEIKDELPGTVRLIFQPAEEMVQGAVAMMNQDPFMLEVDAVVGLHVTPEYPAGTMVFRDGGLMFAGEMFRITVEGKSGHGSQPNLSIDALLAASAIVMNSQSIISREQDPREAAVLTICTMQSGTRHNIMAGSAQMTGTLRCYSETIRTEIKDALCRVAEDTAKAYRASAEVKYDMYVPPVINDPQIGKILRKSAEKVISPERIAQGAAQTASDDFSYYLEKAPGYYVFIGCGDENVKERPMLHNSGFCADESCLPVAAAAYVQFALDLLTSKYGHRELGGK